MVMNTYNLLGLLGFLALLEVEGILGFSAGSSILLVNFLGVLTARLLLVWSRIVRPLGSGVNPNLE